MGGPTQVVGDDLTVRMPKGLRMEQDGDGDGKVLGNPYNKNEVVFGVL